MNYLQITLGKIGVGFVLGLALGSVLLSEAELPSEEEAKVEVTEIGLQSELIYECDEDGQPTTNSFRRACEQFRGPWVWGLHKGRHVAMPAAKSRIPSSELLKWWSLHDPERYEMYMESRNYD